VAFTDHLAVQNVERRKQRSRAVARISVTVVPSLPVRRLESAFPAAS